MADPTLLFFRRGLDSALAEAKKTNSEGFPTDFALHTVHLIQVDNTNLDKSKEEDRVIHLRSFAGVCEMLGLDVKAERKRMLLEIKASYAEAAIAKIQTYVHGRLAAVLACAGVPSLLGKQYQLALVSVEEHDEIAGIERPDPPARVRRNKHKQAEAA